MSTTPAPLPLRVFAVIGLCAAALLAGCAAKPPPPPPPVTMALSVHLAADGNPDGDGRASPVVVRIYQLRSDDAFKNLDLDALYFKDKELLAADLVGHDEWTLRPGETHDSKWTLAPDVRVLAVIGALRSYRNVPWRISVPVPPASPKNAARSTVVEIARDGVHLAPAAPSDKSR